MVDDQPTPWIDTDERMSVYATMLWFAVLDIGLLRAEGIPVPRQLGKPAAPLKRMQKVSH